MSRFRVALYDDAETARTVCEALTRAGFDPDAVAVVTREVPDVDYGSVREVARRALHARADGSLGASLGLVLGGAFGALLGVLFVGACLALVPAAGPGPIWGAGALAGGVIVGGLTGATVGVYLGVHYRRDATGAYLEAVRRGAFMVVVHAGDEVEQAHADAALRVRPPIDLSQRVATWRDDDRAARLSRWRERLRAGRGLPDGPAFHGGTLAI